MFTFADAIFASERWNETMRKIILALTVITLLIAGTSAAFADDEARDAMITYSGTNAFANLLPEERQACMMWVAEGGKMSETCRGAVVRLISEDPDAVTPSQRKALLAAASGTVSASKPKTPAPASADNTPTIKKSDNTGAIIAAGIIGIIAGMVIHNNWPRHKDSSPSYGSPTPYYREQPRYQPAPPKRNSRPVVRQTPPSTRNRRIVAK